MDARDALWFIVSLVLLGMGLYIRPYLGEKGKNLATKEDIRDITRRIEEVKGELQWETRRREQATQVADLLSIWLEKAYDRSIDDNRLRYEVQRKYWELALWLDAAVLRKLNEVFVKGGTPGIKHMEALVAIRKAIVGKEDTITTEELVHWDPIKGPPQES